MVRGFVVRPQYTLTSARTANDCEPIELKIKTADEERQPTEGNQRNDQQISQKNKYYNTILFEMR